MQIKPIADSSIISHPMVTIILIISFIPQSCWFDTFYQFLLIYPLSQVQTLTSSLNYCQWPPHQYPCLAFHLPLGHLLLPESYFKNASPPKNTSSFILVLLSHRPSLITESEFFHIVQDFHNLYSIFPSQGSFPRCPSNKHIQLTFQQLTTFYSTDMPLQLTPLHIVSLLLRLPFQHLSTFKNQPRSLITS